MLNGETSSLSELPISTIYAPFFHAKVPVIVSPNAARSTF